MSCVDIDLILNKLSVKFNKIFCDREFVGCVFQDFRVIIENKSKCCVLVFPVLSPTYLKAVRYQAKLFDLAVFPINCGTVQSVAVCQKKYILHSCVDIKEQFEEPKVDIKMPENVSDISDGAFRKKRPERQLYVPPAQRKSRLSREDTFPQNKKKTSAPQIIQKRNAKTEKQVVEHTVQKDTLLSLRDLKILQNSHLKFFFWYYRVTKSDHILHRHNYCEFENILLIHKYYLPFQVTIFNRTSPNEFLYILDSFYFCWQPKLYFSNNFSDTTFSCANYCTTYPIYNLEGPKNIDNEDVKLVTIFPIDYRWLISTIYKEVENFHNVEMSAFKIECNKSEISECLLEIIDLCEIDEGHLFTICFLEDFYFFECCRDHNVLECYLAKKQQLKEMIDTQRANDLDVEKKSNNLVPQVSQKSLVAQNSERTDLPQLPTDNNAKNTLENNTQNSENNGNIIENYCKSNVIVLNERIECPVKNNNLKNSMISTNMISDSVISTNEEKSPKVKTILRKTSEHEEEKQIMRKAKENINRKTRPIIKYVEGDDTLNIDKTDNINNWEELFDDDGELQDEIFTEIVHKVGSDVTIVKASEDYTAYTTKQIEELEHMVELYDFPPTFETHDIIAAFSELNSDSMYVKWIDETHALLVLGSLTQAQRAVEVSNPLIKVRPMSAASSVAIAKANKFDLKPAMKRPQTNLQTARRLITTHLGAKSRVSKEQTAKEREDLRAAREMKKLAKKNEKDAWEGNLRSSVNN